MENGLLTELLEAITAVHSFLSKDLAKDKLSSKNQKSRHSFIQRLDDVLKKLHSANDAAKQEPLNKEPSLPPPVTVAPPSSHSRPYPPPTDNIPDDDGEVYDIPEQQQDPTQSDQAEYTSFLPVTLENEEPQEEYLAMEADQKEVIDDEMYEDPSQTQQPPPPINSTPKQLPPSLPPSLPRPSSPGYPDLEDQEPGLYEDPVMQGQPTHSSPSPGSGGGYMDPVALTAEDKRISRVPEELIDDWDSVYESNNFGKKKEKVKASKLNNVVMKGWLEKLGGRSHKNWQKRYCVLAEIFMYFYEKESAGTYNNRIPIPGFVPNPSSELTVPKKGHFAFKLSSTDSSGKSKDYYFRAKTEEERDNWVAAIRQIFEKGRVEIEKRKAVTLPNKLSQTSMGSKFPPPTNIVEEQEEYEAIEPAGIIEEVEQEEYEALGPGTTEQDDQEEYVAVPDVINNTELEDSQEEYMDVNPQPLGGGPEEDEQEDYVEPTEALTSYKSSTSLPPPIQKPVTKQPLPPPPTTPTTPSSISQQPLPPPPSSISKQPLPAPPTSISQQPLPAPPSSTPQQPLPVQRPDPVVDTAKVYIQAPNGIKYSNVYVMAWDFEGVGDDELKMKRGDLVLVEEPKQEEEWWFGEQLTQDCSRKLGQSGLFPANYCSIAFEVV